MAFTTSDSGTVNVDEALPDIALTTDLSDASLAGQEITVAVNIAGGNQIIVDNIELTRD